MLTGAKGPVEILDNDEFSFIIGGDDGVLQCVIEMPNTIIANRFLIQEAISTHSQRIEEHALDAMIEGEWVEVAAGTTVGYKKILRFPTIQTNKFRIRILKSRLQPTLSKVSAHFYKSRPPQIQISRDKMGMVTLSPEKHQFMWKSHGLNPMENLNTDLEIHYTTDGSEPTTESDIYTAPFMLTSGEIRVVAFEHDLAGGETSNRFGLLKNSWKLIKVSSLQKTRKMGYWHSIADTRYILAVKRECQPYLKIFRSTWEMTHSLKDLLIPHKRRIRKE